MKFIEEVKKYAISKGTYVCPNCDSPDLLYGIGSQCLTCQHPITNNKPQLETLKYCIHVLNVFICNYNTFSPQDVLVLTEILIKADLQLTNENLSKIKSELIRVKGLGMKAGFISVPDTTIHLNMQNITDETQDIVLELGILVGVISFIKQYISDPVTSSLPSEELKLNKKGCMSIFIASVFFFIFFYFVL